MTIEPGQRRHRGLGRAWTLAALLAAGFSGSGGSGVAAEPTQGPSLVGTFYTPEFLARVAAGRFDPFEYWTSLPLGVTFASDGSAVIQRSGFAGDELRCRVTVQGKSPGLELRAACDGDQKTRVFHWTWTSPGEADSDILAGGEHPHPHLRRAASTFEDLRRDYEAAFKSRQLARLAGFYRAGDGSELGLEPGGRARFGKDVVQVYAVAVRECWDLGAPEPSRTACLELSSPGVAASLGLVVRTPGPGSGLPGNGASPGGPTAERLQLIEGAVNRDELYPDGLPFEPREGGRVFVPR